MLKRLDVLAEAPPLRSTSRKTARTSQLRPAIWPGRCLRRAFETKRSFVTSPVISEGGLVGSVPYDQNGHRQAAVPDPGLDTASASCGRRNASDLCYSPGTSDDGGYAVTVVVDTAGVMPVVVQPHAAPPRLPGSESRVHAGQRMGEASEDDVRQHHQDEHTLGSSESVQMGPDRLDTCL